MNVEIRERKFTLRSEYDISVPGANWFARKAFFSFNDRLQLQRDDGSILAQIRGHFSFFRAKHDFEFSDGRLYRFWFQRHGLKPCPFKALSGRLNQSFPNAVLTGVVSRSVRAHDDHGRKMTCAQETERPTSMKACGPPGGLFGIDQEVVTLRGLYGNSGCARMKHLTDLSRARQSLFTGSVRAVASGNSG